MTFLKVLSKSVQQLCQCPLNTHTQTQVCVIEIVPVLVGAGREEKPSGQRADRGIVSPSVLSGVKDGA